MKILGISGSCRPEATSGTYQLVSRVLEATGCDYELISLAGLYISGCTACLGCVRDNVCVVKDDLQALRDKIVWADAYVIGGPNYYSGLNATTRAFLERWFQFRHQEGNTLWGKLGVAVGVGGVSGEPPADEIEMYFAYNFIETVAKVSAQGTASCFSCGYGESCAVGVPRALFGEGVKISEDMIPRVSKQPAALEAADQAGRYLGERLQKGHDRAAVTRKMQMVMQEKFKGSV